MLKHKVELEELQEREHMSNHTYNFIYCPVCGEGYPEGRPEAKSIEDAIAEVNELYGNKEEREKMIKEVHEEITRWWSDAHIFYGQDDYARQLQERDNRILKIIKL